MRIGQTSLITFVSKVLASVFGFVATIYFARELGAEVLGIYSIIIALTAWFNLIGNIGIGKATSKRISEGNEPGAYLSTGMLLSGALIIVPLVVIFFADSLLESYVEGFAEISPVSVVWVISGLVVVNWLRGYIRVVLNSTHLVHVSAMLKTLQIGLRSVIQVSLVIIGWGLIGMLFGYALGALLVVLLGSYFVTVRPKMPGLRHFKNIANYAKYSWLSGLKSRAYNDIDILLLGIFVSKSLVGIYSVAWTITKFLDMFGVAVSTALFPEISEISAQESKEAAAGLIEDSLTYGGFVVIPGLVGGSLLADRLLKIYGTEFVQGTEILWLLLVSMVFYTYLQQLLNSLNAIDRPDLAFWTNVVFLGSNITLNIILIWALGWVGAAIASATSALLGLIVSYLLVVQVVTIKPPTNEIANQVAAALGMGCLVKILDVLVRETRIVQHNFAIVLGLVFIGAGTYVISLLIISGQFRQIVSRNLPFESVNRVLLAEK
ncbi:flippase [Halovenus rubra]|uniref:Flippase n=2 Tax=Halovenus rubra TaxID=869890 RepID=A0ABD5X5G3_9EURY|nr:flippase [Halovenus rubra]